MGLVELWRRLTGCTPTRRMQAYQLGIARRYYANRAGWDRHCARTRESILSFVTRHQVGELVVLGSGWLLDVPLDELLSQGVSVTLCDIAHPPQVLAQYEGREGVDFLTLDITGGVLDLLNQKRIGESELRVRLSSLQMDSVPLPYTRAVVSVNLLSQLAYPLQERYSNIYGELAKVVQEQHLSLVKRFKRGLVVSDVMEMHYRINTGGHCGTVPTVYCATGGGTEWVWEFDSNGSYTPGERVDLIVHAWEMHG